jgi:hypothetical protein
VCEMFGDERVCYVLKKGDLTSMRLYSVMVESDALAMGRKGGGQSRLGT